MSTWSIKRHWGRGFMILFMLVLLVAGTVMISSLLVGIGFLIAEIFMSQMAAEALEDKYLVNTVIAVASLIGPYALSSSWDGMVSHIPDID